MRCSHGSKTGFGMLGGLLLAGAAVMLASGCGAAKSSGDMSQADQEMETGAASSSQSITEEVLVEMAPFLGYMQAHDKVETPFALLGGPIKVTVRQTAGGAHLALPDYRRLDPRVFGTPAMPIAVAGTPIAEGVPPSMRGASGGDYTELKQLSPFGDKYMIMSDARYSLEAVDAQATDAATTKDTVKMEASWKDKDGNTYTVRCDTPAPHGVEYPSFGGVVTNHVLHGSSRIGTPLMPTEFVYVAFWGTGETLKNGEVMDKSVVVHCMLTELVRGENYTLDFDHQVTPTRVQMHLIVPPVLPGEDGHFKTKPVKTGFMMSNGEEMPFWHIMFSNLEVSAERQPAPEGLVTVTGTASAPGN